MEVKVDKREGILKKTKESKGFTKVLSGVADGQKLQKRFSETKSTLAEDDSEMKLPINFVSPFAGGSSKNKRQKMDRNNITLMEATTQNGKQELKLDVASKKASYVVTAKRDIENKGLREDMKSIDPNTAKKQIRTDDYNLLLARGEKDAAAQMQLAKQRNWTDKIVSQLGGDNRSDMMKRLCPYADTEKEKNELKSAKDELDYIKEVISKEQADNNHGKEIDNLRQKESELQKKIDKLTNLVGRKNIQKGILTQKLKYSTNPTLNSNFYNQFKEGSYLNGVNDQKDNQEPDIKDKNDNDDYNNELGQRIEGDSEE